MWLTWVTGLFGAVILAVVALTWAVSTGRIRASMEDPYSPGIDWAEQSLGPGATWDTPGRAQDEAPPDTRREHADGRHEAQDW